MADDKITGLPPGAVAEPIQTNKIKGLPAGATLEPVSPTSDPNAAAQQLLKSTIQTAIPNIEASKNVTPPPPVVPPGLKAPAAVGNAMQSFTQGLVGDTLQGLKEQGDTVAAQIGDVVSHPKNRLKQLGARIASNPSLYAGPEGLGLAVGQEARVIPESVSQVPSIIKNTFVAPEEPGQTGPERVVRSIGKSIPAALGLLEAGRGIVGGLRPPAKIPLPTEYKPAQQLASALGPKGKELGFNLGRNEDIMSHGANNVVPEIKAVAAKEGMPVNNLTDASKAADKTAAHFENEFNSRVMKPFGKEIVPGEAEARARAIEEQASTFPSDNPKRAVMLEKAQAIRANGDRPLADVKKDIDFANHRYRTFWEKDPASQATALSAQADAAANIAGANALRPVMADFANSKAPGVDWGEWRRTQGNVMELRDALEDRAADLTRRVQADKGTPGWSRARIHEYASSGGHAGFAVGGLKEALFPKSAVELGASDAAIKNLFKGNAGRKPIATSPFPKTTEPPTNVPPTNPFLAAIEEATRGGQKFKPPLPIQGEELSPVEIAARNAEPALVPGKIAELAGIRRVQSVPRPSPLIDPAEQAPYTPQTNIPVGPRALFTPRPEEMLVPPSSAVGHLGRPAVNLGEELGVQRRPLGPQPLFREEDIPHRRFGGPVNQGQPTLVGENGPEVMVPQSDGMIYPLFEGRHFSDAKVDFLSGARRGMSGIGEEGKRLSPTSEPGVYVYRSGTRVEPGIAARKHEYTVRGNFNLADIAHEPAWKQAMMEHGDVNRAETALKGAGFHGYFNSASHHPGVTFLFGDHPAEPVFQRPKGASK